MKKNLGKAAFADPYFSDTETRQIGETADHRAVWQSNFGPPFLVAFDAQNVRHLLEATEGFTVFPHPHRTFADMTRNDAIPAPVGTIRGPHTSGDPRNPCVQFMVQGPGGWVPITRPHRSRDEKECRLAVEDYALQLLATVTP